MADLCAETLESLLARAEPHDVRNLVQGAIGRKRPGHAELTIARL